MKSIIMSIACLFIPLHAAEPSYPSCEWMANEYAQHNKHYIDFFSQCLTERKIETKNKKIISFGCGTGEIEFKLAQQAHVHGVDASNNMVQYAKNKYSNQSNLSFQYCPVEQFKSKELYDLAIAASSFNFFNTEQAIQSVGNCLQTGGKFCANIDTTESPETFGLQVFNDMKKSIPMIGTFLSVLPNPTGVSRHTPGELHIMFTKAHMQVKNQILKSYDITMNEEEWRYAQLPLLLSTRGAQILINTIANGGAAKQIAAAAFWCFTLSEEEKKEHKAPFFPECNDPLVQKIRNNDFCRYLFNNFLKRCLTKMKKNDDGTYTWTYNTTLYLCEKINQ